MAGRNFTVTVKEREAGQPCFLLFELKEEIGLPGKLFMMNLRVGTGFEEAKAIAQTLNADVQSVSLTDDGSRI